MKTRIKPDAVRSAAMFGCTIEQAKALMAKNASQLLSMGDKAKTTGKKVNGYTEADLRESAEEYRIAGGS